MCESSKTGMRLRQVIGSSCELMEEDSASKSCSNVRCSFNLLEVLVLGHSVLESMIDRNSKLVCVDEGIAYNGGAFLMLLSDTLFSFLHTQI